MAYFGTTPAEESHDHDVGEKAKNHPCRLSGASWRVKEKLSRYWRWHWIIALPQSLAAEPLSINGAGSVITVAIVDPF